MSLKRLVALFASLWVLATVAHGSSLPATQPRASFTFNSQTQVLKFVANVSYMSSPIDLQYTYALDFAPWQASSSTKPSSLYAPSTCANRASKQFNLTRPMPWSSIWKFAPSLLTFGALDGRYTAWPVSAPGIWTQTAVVSPAAGGGTVALTGQFTIDKIAACAGSSLVTTVTASTITYAGSLYVVWVQPLGTSPNTFNIYSTVQYAFPFSISLQRQSETATETSTATVVVSDLTDMRVVPVAPGSTLNVLQVTLVTSTPASRFLTVLLSYNALKFVSVLPVNAAPGAANAPAAAKLNMYWNSSSIATSTKCAIDAQSFCAQSWSLYTDARASTTFSGSFQVNFVTQSCTLASSGGSCKPTPFASSIVIQIDGLLGQSNVITAVNPFQSNTTFYKDTQCREVRPSPGVKPFATGEVVHIKQFVTIGQTAVNFYQLNILNAWICSVVPNGVAPLIGFDARYQVTRYGCSLPETLNGVPNIAQAQIRQIITNGVGPGSVLDPAFTLQVNWTHPAALSPSQVCLSFASDPLRTSAFTTLYTHIQSNLVPVGVNFRTQSFGVRDGVRRQQVGTMAVSDDLQVGSLAPMNLTSGDGAAGLKPAVVASVSVVSVFMVGALVGLCCYCRKQSRQKEAQAQQLRLATIRLQLAANARGLQHRV